MARKNSIISSSFENGTLRIAVVGAGEINLTIADMPETILQAAVVHGLTQKISDAAAISKDELSGDAATDAATKFAAMSAVADRLRTGDWSKRSGDGSGPVAGIIYRAFEEWAMAKAKSAKATITAEKCRAVYDAKTRAEQLALRNQPEIAAIIEQMKAERGPSATVDGSALLAELGI